jgi:hypothetical protein
MLNQFVSLKQMFVPVMAQPTPTVSGFGTGTMIRTTQGDMAIETLLAGDVIVTAQGRQIELRGVSINNVHNVDLVTIDPAAHGIGRQAKPLVVGAAQHLLLNDWRMQVVFGDSGLTRASQLVDEVLVRRDTHENAALYTLHFDTPCLVLANGLEAAGGGSIVTQRHTTQTLH